MKTLRFALIASYNAHRPQERVIAEPKEFQPSGLQALRSSADNQRSESVGGIRATSRPASSKGVMVTIISGPVKSVACHPGVNEKRAPFSASVIDAFEVGSRRLSETAGTASEVEKKQENGKAVYGLIAWAVLVTLLVGMLCLMQAAAQQTAGTDQRSLATENESNQGGITFGQALQALSVRR